MGHNLRAVLTFLAVLTLTIAAGLAATGASAATLKPGTVSLTTGSSSYGTVLFTGTGQALYVLSFDTVGTSSGPASSSCTGRCATIWVPLLAGPGGSVAASGLVQSNAVGTIPRTNANGQTVYQVTYFGHPLYTFVRDTVPGQTNGENVAAFLGIWQLMSPNGQVNAGVATVTVQKTAGGASVLSTPTAFSTYRTLYMLTFDQPTAATCLGPCSQFWPPLLTTGAPIGGTGADASLLGTVTRPGGSKQVTYAGHPLYLYTGDLAPGAASGMTTGEGFVDPLARGVWYMLIPTGAPQPTTVTVTASTAGSGTALALQPPATDVPGLYTLYTYSTDTATTSTCTGTCARFWPPLLVSATPTAGTGVDSSKLGTITRADGTTQATYAGHPLYLFVRDAGGSILGNGVNAFGGKFAVIPLSGTPTSPFVAPPTAAPQVVSMNGALSASFTVTFTSVTNGQGEVLFGSGPGCTGLVGVAANDSGAGTNQHSVTVTGNDWGGSAGANPIQPGATYSYEVVTVSKTGAEKNDNNGNCYTVTIPATAG